MKRISRKTMVWTIYIVLIILLVFFGLFKDSAVAEMLIRAVKDAFSILI